MNKSPTSPQKNKIEELNRSYQEFLDTAEEISKDKSRTGTEVAIAFQRVKTAHDYLVSEAPSSSREELVDELLEYLIKLKNRVDNSIMTPEREAENRALNKVRVFLLSKK